MDDKIKKLEQMIAANDPATMDCLAEIVAEAKSPEDKARLDELAAQLMTGANECLDRVENAVNEQLLRDQLGPLAEALNMSYIARTYFGRSRSWLSQRLNGHTVHGRKAILTDDERMTLNDALNDIQSQITAFTHSA
ncbi:MAG: DUF5053 domain-containing protein [Muribaculaceae bacterium]|nr:DUF5053 domain-containing protein [Muribaculaceae bacterium]